MLPCTVLYALISPPVVLYAIATGLQGVFGIEGLGVEGLLVEMARGWVAQGVWTGLVVWGVWWPAWVVGGGVLGSGVLGRGGGG